VNDWTRRDVLAMLAAAAWTPLVWRHDSQVTTAGAHGGPTGFRVRTITAGTNLKSLADTRAVDAALATLKRAKQTVTDAGYEVQTVRIATQPLLEDAAPRARAAAMGALQALDRAVVAESALLSIGPVLAPDGNDPEFGAWAAELARTTKNISFTVRVASPERGTSPRGVTAAGDAMAAIARTTPGGIGNFRFAAAANVPAGTPFFPVAYHSGSDAMAIGLESPPLLSAGLAEANTLGEAKQHLTELLESRLGPLERDRSHRVVRQRRYDRHRAQHHYLHLHGRQQYVCRDRGASAGGAIRHGDLPGQRRRRHRRRIVASRWSLVASQRSEPEPLATNDWRLATWTFAPTLW